MNRRKNKMLLSAVIIATFLLSWGYAQSADVPGPQAAPADAAKPASPAPDHSKPAVETKRLAGYKYSGFLSDYSKLQPAPDGSEAMSWRKPGVDFKAYDKIIVERLNFFYHEQADYKGIDPTEL
mgnify:CR=1 FL=1